MERSTCVLWVQGYLVLGRVAYESFRIAEGHIRRRDAIPLIVGDDFYPVVLPDTNARIGSTQVNADIQYLMMHLCTLVGKA